MPSEGNESIPGQQSDMSDSTQSDDSDAANASAHGLDDGDDDRVDTHVNGR